MTARCLTAVLAVVLSTQPLRAQTRTAVAPTRGVSLMGGAGIGWTRPACDFCRRERDPGPVVYLSMLSHLRPNLAIGAEANAWAREGVVFTLAASLTGVAQLYPTPGGPFYMRAGLGIMTFRAYDDDADLVSNAPAMQLGAGYRFRIGDGLVLSNFANVLVSRFGSLRSEDDVIVENFGVTSIQLGIGLARH